MKKDITSKETIKAITYDIATYILELDISEDFTFVDKELQRVEKREADIVVDCKIAGKEAILHIEIQNSNDYSMARRMLRYYSDIKFRYSDKPIYQYVVHIGKEKSYMPNRIEDDNLSFEYKIIDMHTIDCEEFINMDNPDALVLSILCDFKNRDELDVVLFILKRLKELLKDDDNELSKYMLILETLSDNRDLKDKIKEAEDMLRDVSLERLPSYEIGLKRGVEMGMERGMERGIERGMERGELKAAIIMMKKFNLPAEEVAKNLGISINTLLSELNKY